MKNIKLLAAAITLCASASFAADGMFSDALPKNWNADVLASAQFTRHHYSNWKNGADGVNTNVWILKYDADVIGHFSHFDWRTLVNLPSPPPNGPSPIRRARVPVRRTIRFSLKRPLLKTILSRLNRMQASASNPSSPRAIPMMTTM